MSELSLQNQVQIRIELDGLKQLFDVLRKRGYLTVGPTIKDKAIIYDELSSINDLPIGWTDEQNGGSYRIKKRSDEALFGYVVGPHSWKKFLYPSTTRLWQTKQGDKNIEIVQENYVPHKFAFIGVRPCELSAISIQDKVFTSGDYIDPFYNARRKNTFIIAVNCSHSGGTCFCVSMNTGPKAKSGFDVSLLEVLDNENHYFIAEIGTELGMEIINEIPRRDASNEEKEIGKNIVQKTAKEMERKVDTTDIQKLLYDNYEHREWDEVAKRCLTCGNCTMVCPTCFCSNIEDTTNLSGNTAERWKKWDSCFTVDFSYIHGGSIRALPKTRYRQWLMHKFATWLDQFGTFGCVGCGRCITWCPVGIDITEEIKSIRKNKI